MAAGTGTRSRTRRKAEADATAGATAKAAPRQAPGPTEDAKTASAPAARLITDAEVALILTPELARASQREAFRALGEGTAALAGRLLMDGADDSISFSYFARLRPDAPAVSKLGSVVPANAARGLPVVSATVHVLDGETGLPAATIQAEELTTIRTAAASALAVEELAAGGESVLGVIGAGVQARAHALAISEVRELEEIRIASRRPAGARKLAKELDAILPATVRAVPAERAAAAPLVACCTTSFGPVLETSWVRPGATIVSVGAFAPDREEVPVSLLERAGLVVVDHVETAAAQCGPVAAGLADGRLELASITALGDIVARSRPGRRSPDDIAIFLSVGLGVQDAAAAEAILSAAARR